MHILRREYKLNISESKVGRILKYLMEKSTPAPRIKRKRNFDKHAKRWKYGMKSKEVGELVQIDHMSVSKNGVYMKHFQCWDRVSKYMYANVYSNAKSRTAKKFLNELIEKAPFKIQAIQVDGGSEFMAEFEEECEEKKIELYVLPPRRSQYNGGVERGNRILREDTLGG